MVHGTGGTNLNTVPLDGRGALPGRLPQACDDRVQWLPRPFVPWRVRLALLVLSVTVVVHWSPESEFPAAQAAEPKRGASPQTRQSNEKLPRAVKEMRDAILLAVLSGRLEDLKAAVELNEMMPDLGDTAGGDPVSIWRSQSKDGSGRDILEALGRILAVPPALEPLGPDIENNAIYVWPYLAQRVAEPLTAAEETDLAGLVTPEDAAAIKAAKRWTGWRLTIGADGVWHSFRRER